MPMMMRFTACEVTIVRDLALECDRETERTAVRMPEIQKALPNGAGWNRKMRAKNTPPALPIAPTMPPCKVRQ